MNLLELVQDLNPEWFGELPGQPTLKSIGKALARGGLVGNTAGVADATFPGIDALGLLRSNPAAAAAVRALANGDIYGRVSKAVGLDTPELGETNNVVLDLLGGGLGPLFMVNAGKAGRAISKAVPLVPSRDGGLGGNQIGAIGDLTGIFAPNRSPVRGRTSSELAAQQRSALNAEQLSKLEDLRSRYPAFGAASRYMTPQEVIKTISRQPNVERVNELLNLLPTAEKMAAYAKAGAAKQGWYRASTQALIDVFGDDAPRFASLLAATSPQTSVESNLLNALNIWRNWTAAGRPTEAGAIKRIMGASVQGSKGEDSILNAWLGNATRALTVPDPSMLTLSGPKVDSFFRNLADDVYRVTNDAWMANGLGVDQKLFSGVGKNLERGDPGFGPGYIAASARTRQGAQRANMFPDEGQETIWSMTMPLYEMQARTGLPARALLDRGLITPDVIRGTPDFSTLLNQGLFKDILEQSGYGEQLSKLRPHQWSDDLPSLSLAEQRHVDELAARLEGLRGDRARESFAISTPSGSPGQAVAASTYEMMPYHGSQHLTDVLGKTDPEKDVFSASRATAFRDMRGHDLLQSSMSPNTLEVKTAQGAYFPEGFAPEYNAAYAASQLVPYTIKNGSASVPRSLLDQLIAQERVRGGLSVQGGTPFNIMVMDEGLLPEATTSVFAPRKSKVSRDEIQQLAGIVGDSGAAADTGRGVSLISFGEDLKKKLDDIKSIPGAGPVPAQNLGEYVGFEEMWEKPGEGLVTRSILEAVRKLKKRDQSALGEAAAKPARSLFDMDATYKNRNPSAPFREDVQTLRDIIARGGRTAWDDLQRALDRGVALPSIAGGVLSPSLFELLRQEEGQF